MKAFITSIGTAAPEHKLSQKDIADMMREVLDLNEDESQRLQALYRASGIENRHTVLKDYNQEFSSYEFFPNNPQMEPFPLIGKRMRIYEKQALKLSVTAVERCLSQTALLVQDITHLITVSCTGMYAPGLDIELVERLGMSPDVERTCINFMGCYAAFNALKIANNICRNDPSSKVLIVCVELCSLHFLKNRNEGQILSNALFSDGAAAVLVEGDHSFGMSLEILSFYSTLALQGKRDMAWHITDTGFEMALSSYVPNLIKSGIKDLTTRLLDKIGLSFKEIELFAIHPGGKRILEEIESELGITKKQNRHAYYILREFGNMSSPTVLFVLQSMMKELELEDKGKKVLSFAFGPGLTLESALFKVCRY